MPDWARCFSRSPALPPSLPISAVKGGVLAGRLLVCDILVEILVLFLDVLEVLVALLGDVPDVLLVEVALLFVTGLAIALFSHGCPPLAPQAASEVPRAYGRLTVK